MSRLKQTLLWSVAARAVLGVFESTSGLTKWANSGGAGPDRRDSISGRTRGSLTYSPLARVQPGGSDEDIHYQNTRYNQDLGFYVVGLG